MKDGVKSQRKRRGFYVAGRPAKRLTNLGSVTSISQVLYLIFLTSPAYEAIERISSIDGFRAQEHPDGLSLPFSHTQTKIHGSPASFDQGCGTPVLTNKSVPPCAIRVPPPPSSRLRLLRSIGLLLHRSPYRIASVLGLYLGLDRQRGIT